MEDELIITVIATGFDSEYFHEQAQNIELPEAGIGQQTNVQKQQTEEPTEVAEADLSDIDMQLDKKEDPHDVFTSEDEKNIWQYNEEESDTPAFLRRRKKDKKE
jgi:hypothetical protein